MTETIKELRQLTSAQFDAAKKWWAISIFCRLLVVVVGVFSALTSVYVEWVGLFAALLTVLYPLLLWLVDDRRNAAETILRKLELYDGLAWPITGKEIADLRFIVSSSVKKIAKDLEVTQYFDSNEEQSHQRVLENLEQSCWYTKHQARKLSRWIARFSIAVFTIALIVLIVTLLASKDQDTSVVVAKIVIAFIVFIFAGGYVRLAFSYNSFYKDAEMIEHRAAHLIKSNDLTERQTIKALHDYQLMRVNSPMLPNWLWKRMEPELNESWLLHKK